MAAKKTSKQSKAKQTKMDTRNGNRQVTAIILFAVAVFLFCLAIIQGTNGWYFLHKVFGGLFGVCAYVLPIILAYVAIIISSDKEHSFSLKIWEGIILMVLTCAGLQIFFTDVAEDGFFEFVKSGYIEGTSMRYGGAIGALIGFCIEKLMGDTGAKIITVISVFIFFMLVSGSTIIGLFRTLKKPVVKTHESIKTAIDEYSEREEERKEAIKQEQIEEKRPRRKIRIEEVDVSPSSHSIDVDMGEGYHTPESDLHEVTRSVDKEIAELKGETYEEEYNEKADTPELKEFKEDVKEFHDDGKTESEADDKVETVSEQPKEPEAPAYRYPPLSLLNKNISSGREGSSSADLKHTSDLLVKILSDFHVGVTATDIVPGPSVTRFEFEPDPGVSLTKIAKCADDIALRLAVSGVRIAAIPNKAAVGIEVPNDSRNMVGLRELMEDNSFVSSKSKLMVPLGKDISGQLVKADISAMPHLLIAGTTGSGKSVCTNSMILSMLFRASPEEVKLILIDPKKVEFNAYNGIPHLLVPVVTDPKKAAGSLGWALVEMNKRYQTFADNKVKDILSFNEKAKKNEELEKMPYIVVIIDEFADLMMTAGADVEASVCRLAQLGRAAGIHLIVATQRPSTDVITGLIKANIPSRLALTVATGIDSRTIIDTVGAEELLGHGDMLFMPIGTSKPIRVQGCFVSDEEKEKVISFLQPEEGTQYDESVMEEINRQAESCGNTKASSNAGGDIDTSSDGDCDEMLSKAIEAVVNAGEASVSMLQRKLRVGYARAGRMIDEMEERGIVGPSEGSKSRKVLITREQWLEMNMNRDEV